MLLFWFLLAHCKARPPYKLDFLVKIHFFKWTFILSLSSEPLIPNYPLPDPGGLVENYIYKYSLKTFPNVLLANKVARFSSSSQSKLVISNFRNLFYSGTFAQPSRHLLLWFSIGFYRKFKSIFWLWHDLLYFQNTKYLPALISAGKASQ